MIRNRLFVFAALLAAASPAFAVVRNVNPVTGNPAASGTALLNALASIPANQATQANPSVVRLAPGIYNVGNTSLVMRPWVDIEGSGQKSTVITGLGNNNLSYFTAVVHGANNAELRNLRVDSRGLNFGASIAILLLGVNTSIRDVTISSNNATATWGIRNVDSNPTIQDVTILVNGQPGGPSNSVAYGIVNTGNIISSTLKFPVIRRTVINGSTATTVYGIYNAENSVPLIRDVEITVNAQRAVGIQYIYSASNNVPLEITNSRINASGLSNVIGIDLQGSDNLTVTHTDLIAQTGLRISTSSPSVVVRVDHCDINGTTNSIMALSGIVQVGASKLASPALIALGTCAGSFNGSYVPLSTNCL